MSAVALSRPLRRALLFAALAVIALGILFSNQWQLAEANEYLGYQRIDVDGVYLLVLLTSIALASLVMPLEVRRPSDFFRFFHVLLVVLPYVVLFRIRGPVDWHTFLLALSFLMLPLVIVRGGVLLTPRMRPPALMAERLLIWIVAIICIIGMTAAVALAPSSAGFELSYERRMDGREVFRAGSAIAYLNSAVANGFAPFLAFLAGNSVRCSLKLFALALISALSFYYAIGLKAPLLLVLLAFATGILLRGARTHRVLRLVVLGLGSVLALFVVEYSVAGYSYVNDYLIRRALTVPPFLISAYVEFMFADTQTLWTPGGGVSTGVPISFHIGEAYLGFPGLNANTNTFLHTLAAGGLPAYGATILTVSGVFAILDGVYKTTHSAALLYFGLLFSLLLTEQAVTTILASSGLAVLIALAVLTGRSADSARHESTTSPSPLRFDPDQSYPIVDE